jgi:hypothetical protein
VKLSGVLYLGCINDATMTTATWRYLSAFERICGRHNFKYVILVSTGWDTSSEATATRREGELIKSFWHDMIQNGSIVQRHDGSRDSALRIVSTIVDRNERIVPELQRDMNKGLNCEDTAAGRFLALRANRYREHQEATDNTYQDSDGEGDAEDLDHRSAEFDRMPEELKHMSPLTDFATLGGERSAIIFVRNLPWSTSNEDLVELFTTIGKVERAEMQGEANGRCRGCGVVEFDSADNAETAIAKFTGYRYGGRPLNLTFVKYTNQDGNGMEGAEGTAANGQDGAELSRHSDMPARALQTQIHVLEAQIDELTMEYYKLTGGLEGIDLDNLGLNHEQRGLVDGNEATIRRLKQQRRSLRIKLQQKHEKH